jgi:hypothetical protein
MAIRAKDIYQGRKKSRSHIGVVIAVIFAVLVLAVLAFYGLRNYCVYDENGNATLVLPFSKKAQTEEVTQSPSASPSESPSASPSVSPSVSPSENPTASPSVSPIESPVASAKVS